VLGNRIKIKTTYYYYSQKGVRTAFAKTKFEFLFAYFLLLFAYFVCLFVCAFVALRFFYLFSSFFPLISLPSLSFSNYAEHKIHKYRYFSIYVIWERQKYIFSNFRLKLFFVCFCKWQF